MSTPEDPNSLSAFENSLCFIVQDLASALRAEAPLCAPTDVDTKIKKRKRLLHLAKYRAIGILNEGKGQNIFRARTSLLSDFIDWKIYKKGDSALTILVAVSNEKFTEEFINDFD